MVARSGDEADEVGRRAMVFRARLAAHHATGRAGVPILTLLDDPPLDELPRARPGRCLSCDAALTPGRAWRCPLCLRAVEQALGLAADAP